MTINKQVPVQNTGGTSDNDVLNTIRIRRSVRRYQDKPVDSRLIDRILEAGKMAPSALNRQPWRFYVISRPDMISEFSKAVRHAGAEALQMKGLKNILRSAADALHFPKSLKIALSEDPVFHGAPVVVLISATEDNEWTCFDIGACAQNMMLAAKSMGLDTCPIGLAKLIKDTEPEAKLNLQKGERIMLAVAIGYGNETPEMHKRVTGNTVYFS